MERTYISPVTDSSISPLGWRRTQQPKMVQRDAYGNWVADGTMASLVKERHEVNVETQGSNSALSAAAFGSFSLDASGVGSHGMAEMQRAAQRAQSTRILAVVRERATAPYEPQFDPSHFEPSHVEYAASRWQQLHHQPQQIIQQQAHHGVFYQTPPNYSNLPHQPSRNAPIIPQGFQPQTNGPSNNPARGRTKGSKSSAKRKSRGQDAIVAPSAASGGVPEPTPAYLLRASFLPRALPEPQPLLVVIDLNGTLVHRPSASRNPRQFVARPFAREFLRYCVDTFHVMIWSSARPANVAAMCEKLLDADQLRRLVAVWGRDRFGLTPDDYDRRVQCYKRLSTVWADPAVRATYPPDYDDAGRRIEDGDDEDGWGRWNSSPRKSGFWNQGNTVLIDDSREKARSEPHNAIEIPEFLGGKEVGEEEALRVLPRVHDYLNTLAGQADVSTYVRVHPFKPVDEEALKHL